MSAQPSLPAPRPGNLRRGIIVFLLLLVVIVLAGLYVLAENGRLQEHQDKLKASPGFQADPR